MLTEERHLKIQEVVNRNGSATLAEICEILSISESTARRDLKEMDEKNLITRVHGGAISVNNENLSYKEADVEEKSQVSTEEKIKIARYAASLVVPDDFIFLDAGTTTEKMIEFLPDNITVVTTGLVLAIKLARRGIKVLVPEGEVKGSTIALVGAECTDKIKSYNFTKCFIGTNGVSVKNGLTTPDKAEAMVKKAAISKSKDAYILADSSKFGSVSAVTFAELSEVAVITDKIIDKRYIKAGNIQEA